MQIQASAIDVEEVAEGSVQCARQEFANSGKTRHAVSSSLPKVPSTVLVSVDVSTCF